jgi:hypothetical protein
MLLYIAKIISASSAAKICNLSACSKIILKIFFLKWFKNLNKYCRAYFLDAVVFARGSAKALNFCAAEMV